MMGKIYQFGCTGWANYKSCWAFAQPLSSLEPPLIWAGRGWGRPTLISVLWPSPAPTSPRATDMVGYGCCQPSSAGGVFVWVYVYMWVWLCMGVSVLCPLVRIFLHSSVCTYTRRDGWRRSLPLWLLHEQGPFTYMAWQHHQPTSISLCWCRRAQITIARRCTCRPMSASGTRMFPHQRKCCRRLSLKTRALDACKHWDVLTILRT